MPAVWFSVTKGNLLSWSCKYFKVFKVGQQAWPWKLPPRPPRQCEDAAKTVNTRIARGSIAQAFRHKRHNYPGFLHFLLMPLALSTSNVAVWKSCAVEHWPWITWELPLSCQSYEAIKYTYLSEDMFLGSAEFDFWISTFKKLKLQATPAHWAHLIWEVILREW